MILNNEQLKRYSRHIIMPEVNISGQTKLCDASVLIQAESPEASAPLLYYLAAVGIGHIYCVVQEEQSYETLLGNLRDLNSDVSITLDHELPDRMLQNRLSIRILLGSEEYVSRHVSSRLDIWTPMIVAINRGWEAYLQVFKRREQMEGSVPALQTAIQQHTILHHEEDDNIGRIFSTCLLGALTSIEAIKLLLDLGTSVENPFSFNLLSMNFDRQENNNPSMARFFTYQAGSSNYKYSFINDEEGVPKHLKRLSECKALIVGTGGLGSPAAYALAKAGIGTIGLVDYDTVEISNLNRQILHSASRLSLPKVDSAEIFLRRLNPNVTIIKHQIKFSPDNALEMISGYDVMIDGVDNFPTRYLLNDACFFKKKPMIEAGVAGFNGMGLTIIPGISLCYRCIFPTIPAPGILPSGMESGILGPVPGVMGFIQACEAVKLLTAKGTPLKDSLLAFDALDLEFNVFKAEKNVTCALCGITPSITELRCSQPD